MQTRFEKPAGRLGANGSATKSWPLGRANEHDSSVGTSPIKTADPPCEPYRFAAAAQAPGNGPRPRASGKSLWPLVLSAMALAWATGAIGQSPSSFGRVGWWPGYLRGDVKCVATAGRYAYLGTALTAGLGGCNSPAWCGRLEVMDVSDPARPVWVGGYDFRDPVQRIQVTSNYVYVASGITLNVLTVTNPAAPVLVGRWGSAPSDLGGWTFHLQGSYAYAMWRDTLDIFDVSNPAQLERVGGCPLGLVGCSGLRVAGNYAYAATFSGLRVVDVSIPSQPVLLFSEDDPGA